MNELNLKVTVPAELVGKLLQNGLASVIDSCTVSVMGEQPEVTTKPQPIVLPDPEVPRPKKKLIKFICPECQRMNFAMVEEENKKYSMSCRGCKTDYDFTNRDLVRVEYECAECGEERYYFTPYMEGMEVTKDECKCGHKTNLKYNAAFGEFYAVEG